MEMIIFYKFIYYLMHSSTFFSLICWLILFYHSLNNWFIENLSFFFFINYLYKKFFFSYSFIHYQRMYFLLSFIHSCILSYTLESIRIFFNFSEFFYLFYLFSIDLFKITVCSNFYIRVWIHQFIHLSIF